MTAALAPANWIGRLELKFAPRGDRTILASRRHVGPLAIQKPFHPGDGVCHAYLLHPPGGVVGGDHLSIRVDVDEGAKALVTTPAAGKFYRSNGTEAVLRQEVNVTAGASCEWLPQETILFAGCHATMSTRINLGGDARFIGWEILCLGRPAANEAFHQGSFRQSFEIVRNDVPLLLERCRLQGGTAVLSAPWGLNGYEVMGTLVATPADKNELQSARAVCASVEQGLASTSLIGDVLVCRYLAPHAQAVLKHFQYLWVELRSEVIGVQASAPRIWAT